MGGYAWVTLATNDAYCLGALVLAHSLRRVGTKYELAVLITPGVTQTMREKLSTVFSVVMEVNVLDSKDEANLALLARPELGITFTKLHCWRLTQYDKCVFLDADTLVVRNCDELFEREELSAAPDVGWPDCFNSGVFVYKPSQQTFASITAFAAAKGSFDGGDQGLLNMYFSDWATKDISNHLPFIYNMCSTATYSYLPAFKQFGDDVRIIHFIGITKPWLQYFDTLTGIVQPPPGSTHLQPLLQLWWNIFCESVHSQLSPVMATSTLAPIWHEFTPVPFQHPTPLRSSTYTDTTDRTQNDIYVQPDFSEFQDPWENYLTRNNSIIHETEDNVTQQYYSTTNTCSPAPTFVNQTHYEPPTEHGRTHYQQQYIEPLHIQHNHNQEQISDYVNNETEQQHSYFHPSDTSVSNARHTWHNRPSVPVYNVQNHHSNESQHQHVDHHHQYISPMSHYDNNNTLSSEETREHKHVDYQSVYQQNSFNNNESPSEEVIKRQQHNEHYVDCNHYKTSNSEQFNHHYKKENNESVNIKTDHDRPVDDNNIAHKNDHLTERKAVRNKNVNFTDERTKTSVSFSPIPNSKPCTDIHKVATQSDLHVMDDLSNSNGGLAGALAQMTLGEPRSAEQIALEEHMRKQSWEQGHIDYMGRDSFDNIWKKICETLALAPSRLPSPPKETEKPAKTATDKTDSIKDDSIISSDTTQSIESVDEADKGAGGTEDSN
ncbi:myb-like protein D isoform X3 [Ceratina calcarata]|uniref:glycogenin glucosyltransferase n=1 Tax=Ceratina calcarata TaxID=156304 RepID=A0AAJ7S7J4_9HYME|nr:myb-like protein D isoform X3 [Ceratina calcarata]